MATQENRLARRWAGLNREKLGNVNVGQTERWASVLGGAAFVAWIRIPAMPASGAELSETSPPLIWTESPTT